MKRILLIRHCHATGQHRDSPLSRQGLQQAHDLISKIEALSFPIDRIITSPYLRAQETIKPFAISHQIAVEVDERLKERLLSEEPIDDWMDILEESFLNLHFKLPGGESSNEAYKRAEEVLDECMEDEMNENIIIVTHGNLLALMLQKFYVDFGFHEWKSLSNPDMFLISHNEDDERVERIWEENPPHDI
ncbi:histidine phosphatase family protein [Gracilibacillus sp. S3-1-1]|uniref:Histidine phosphatase family protein n=1 Tax=Gracilibacillus pellucidus TaxID=3095368 RepID=A0ACC6M5L9_9BACI|nr:histidine phosphatase family protein [Gracilibacillus sp. S3-1-1]MDX8046186.1 histidine phosphatase family protein [Gracilibacillus sp. S3-1-1]